MSNRPTVKKDDWIKIGTSRIDALVMHTSEEHISVGYYQNHAKAIKEDVIWDGERWQFEHSGPSGSYLRGAEEAAVKRGPPY